MSEDLPPPSADDRVVSASFSHIIRAEIAAAGGWMSFARYMELALYAPGLGYYSGGARKFGAAGDFVTAPELTPLFGQALARQIAQILHGSLPRMIEAGAGSGRLAADLLPALDALGCAPERYGILELSGELRARQQATLAEHAPAFLNRVEWLDELPDRFSGCLLGNEVLDAMPTHIALWSSNGISEMGVGIADDQLSWAERPAAGALLDAAQALPVKVPYYGEIGLAARSWVSELSRRLECGAILLLDYGLPRHELYHPLQERGTVRCHPRHRVHNDPFWYPGLSDITSHVDFTAVAEAGFDAGLEVMGYCNQATFLINCGIGELLHAKVGAEDTASAAYKAQTAVNMLLAPNEMGELFKVIALGKRLPLPLLGFTHGDKVHTL
jgi:SAM-dependent MidA family methyltransferase